jgi:signal peptidase II
MRTRTAARALLVALAVVVLDQVTKAIVRSSIPRGGSVDVLGILDLVNARNTGIAFSLFTDSGALVVVVALVALVALGALLGRAGHRPLVWLPAGLLVGGAVGNLIDRVREGAVTDFIDFPLWPAFNVADSAITVGVVALVWVLERRPRPARVG